MPTLSTPFDQWTFATIQQLIADRVTESVTVEFKRDMPHAQPRDREEVAKDISSMANSAGGWIIYGVDEKPVGNPPVKVAAALAPLTGPPDAAHWVDDVVANKVTPKPRFRAREITGNGGLFVLVYVYPSTDDLHMVGERYYRRTEQGARPMTEPEVRQAYSLIARRRVDGASYTRSIIESDIVGAPEPGFFIGLIPQTFADVIDTSQLSHQTPVFALLGVDVVREIAQHALGIEADHKGYHRFRARRDGTVSVGFLGFGADNWRVDEFLVECMQVVAVARALWNDFGVRQPSTLSIRVRMPQDRMASSGMVRSSRLTPLPYKLDIDLPIDIADVLGSPLSIPRRALDRLYNAMGQARAPHFEQDGSLRTDLVKHFAPQLLAALRSS